MKTQALVAKSNLFNFSTDTIAVVSLKNTEMGNVYADDRTPCINLDFPDFDFEVEDSLMCKGDFMTQDLPKYQDDDDYSVDFDQSDFSNVGVPVAWHDYIEDAEKSFGITIEHRGNTEWLYIIPIKENWSEIIKEKKCLKVKIEGERISNETN